MECFHSWYKLFVDSPGEMSAEIAVPTGCHQIQMQQGEWYKGHMCTTHLQQWSLSLSCSLLIFVCCPSSNQFPLCFWRFFNIKKILVTFCLFKWVHLPHYIKIAMSSHWDWRFLQPYNVHQIQKFPLLLNKHLSKEKAEFTIITIIMSWCNNSMESLSKTDKTIHNSKLDIIIHNNGKGTCMLIDVAISGDRNVIEKEAKKILK